MLKETGTEKHRLFCHIFINGVILIGGGSTSPPGYANVERWARGTVPYGIALRSCYCIVIALLLLLHYANPALVIALRSLKGKMRAWDSNF